MSKRPNNRFNMESHNIDTQQYRKCAHHVKSINYMNHVKQHHTIATGSGDLLRIVDIDTPINIVLVFHFLAPRGTYSKERVQNRAADVVTSLNDDFNNYSPSANTMNNLRYKNIINQVFISNIPKQNIYLGAKYLELIPTRPSNIIFQLGEIYYYPVKHQLNLSSYDDIKDVDIEHQVIGQFICRHGAKAIHPDNFLNIWIVDITGTNILGFSNFPWESANDYYGIIINRRAFLPEDYNESAFSAYKTFTHEIGHFLGLLHVPNHHSGPGVQPIGNINDDSDIPLDPQSLQKDNTIPILAYDPTDKNQNKLLHYEPDFNPLFMNFMDNSYDKYCTMFTNKQIQIMRHMIIAYKPNINSIIHRVKLPNPKYNPDTDTMVGIANYRLTNSNQKLIPPMESIGGNPRINAAASSLINQPVYQQQMTPNDIGQLIPNLSSGNMGNTPLNHEQQIIANIQKNLPSNQQSVPPPNQYDIMMQKFNNYNSADGYARKYPFDPYVMDQYNKNMGVIMQQENATKNVVNMNPNDPRLARQSGQSIQQIDPRFAGQQIDPRFAGQQFDPRFAGQQFDPRFAGQQFDPRMMHPYSYQSVDPMAATYDPQYIAYQKKLNNDKKKSRKNKQSGKNDFNKKIIDDMMNSEINDEAVNNLRIPKNNTNNLRAITKKKAIEKNLINNQNIPNLVSRISAINNQLQDIKSKIPINKPTNIKQPALQTKFVRSRPTLPN